MNNCNSIPVSVSALPFNYLKRGQDWTGDACGSEQSPIDIIPANAQPSDETMKMQVHLTDHLLTGLKVNDNGNTYMVNGDFSKLLATDVDGQTYEFEAVQFHFHAPTEHTINGKHFDLELHIVHQMTLESANKAQTQRNLAVLGIMFELDCESHASPHPFIDSLNLQEIGKDFSLNMSDLLGDDLTDKMTYYAYKGSLTTPPCTESVNWYVLEKPLKITKDQLDIFNSRWKYNPCFAHGFGNNRPVQPLNGRTVLKSTNCCVMNRSEVSLMKMSLGQEEEEKEGELKQTSVKRRSLDEIEFMKDLALEDLSFLNPNGKDCSNELIEPNYFINKTKVI